ncbi:MAG TPA: restriction endonuclease [Actinomycetota bacterium]
MLLNEPEGVQAREVLRRVEQVIPPTEFEAADYPNRPGVRRYEKIVRFASIRPVKAGWLVKDGGKWTLTPEGRSAYERYSDPGAFTREARRLYRAWRLEQSDASGDVADTDEEAADEVAPDPRTTLEEAEENAWSAIADYLARMPPFEFQDLVAALLRAMGYHIAWTAPPGPDRGIDIVAFQDPLGATSPRIKVQVKRRAGRIPADELRSFMAVLGQDEVGIYVSIGGFTSDAEVEARGQERRSVTLIDMRRLVSLWIEHYDRLIEEDRSLLPLKPVHFLTAAL